MAFEFSSKPKADIKYGSLTPESKSEIQDWMLYNMRKFLVTELLGVTSLVPHDKEIQEFCKTLYDEIHEVGYEEGFESAVNTVKDN